jgi:FliI/YscN family ATPase
MADIDLGKAFARLEAATPRRESGRVTEVTGLVIRASVPGVRIGEVVSIAPPDGGGGRRADAPPLRAEVVGFRGDEIVLMPLGEATGIGPDSLVTPTSRPFSIGVSDRLLGRVLDGLGRPLDGGPTLEGVRRRPVLAPPPPAMSRPRIARRFETGVRSIDLMNSLGEGQRVGIFAGSGVGKSTLLGKVLREAKADVTVVALIGERGREVRHFVDDLLGAEGRARSVVVASTSDRPALQRMKGAHLAATVAEHFRDEGRRVLLVMDSVTRFAMALREAGLAAGEPPTTRGYPPSLFSELPRLVERFGTSAQGSITALLTVLVEGDDLNDPVSDALRGLLDGHLVLSRSLAERGHYPPVDPLKSLSRLMDAVASRRQMAAAQKLRAWLAIYEDHRDLIEIGAYRRGSGPLLDKVMEKLPQIHALLRQGIDEKENFPAALQQLCVVTETPEDGART